MCGVLVVYWCIGSVCGLVCCVCHIRNSIIIQVVLVHQHLVRWSYTTEERYMVTIFLTVSKDRKGHNKIGTVYPLINSGLVSLVLYFKIKTKNLIMKNQLKKQVLSSHSGSQGIIKKQQDCSF